MSVCGPTWSSRASPSCPETRACIAPLRAAGYPFNVDREAGVAQLVEQLICNQPVGGSNPLASSIPIPSPPITGDGRYVENHNFSAAMPFVPLRE